MASDDDLLDCIIVGAGAAGLTAAVYLARFRRRIALLDGAGSRLLLIPESHNYPGYAHGIHGPDVLARLREQALQYDVQVQNTTIDSLERDAHGNFVARAEHRSWRARTALLATGVTDVAPPFAEVSTALATGRLRYCPICDGYEAIGRSAAVLGRGNSGVEEAIFVRHFADKVYVCALDDPLQLDDGQRERLARARVDVVAPPVTALGLSNGPHERMWLALDDGGELDVDIVYAALGTLVNSGLGQLLGAQCADNDELLVDAHQQTSVDGLYAAGDVVIGLNQIAVAMGHAAIAATAIHNRLRTRQ
ncbi:MAG TPA: NAD(P)/FAD-dependent oxidoreductase [Noviherbaspirillum sp.]|nr:NAD(P)/FAD-dependent oxidoreductase [Noviherbaspirillum sp.]